MWTYLIINILILSIPLLLSFEKRVSYYKNFNALFYSILIVGIVFVAWDAIATHYNHWSFNKDYILGPSVFNLPFEELLFFITVPYSCIFIYECLSYFLKKPNEAQINVIKRNKELFYALSLILTLVAFAFKKKYYTSTILIICALTLILILHINPKLMYLKTYWIFILVTYIPFFIVNYFLTSIPVVIYNSKAILGNRVSTIPIEDFLYSFVMVSLYLIVYLKLKTYFKQ